MAEAIGLVASLATLSKIFKLTSEILRIIIDAPEQIRQLGQEVSQLSAQAIIVLEIQQECMQTEDERILHAQHQSIALAQVSISELELEFSKLRTSSEGKKGRFKWLLVGQENARRLFEHLSSTRTSLNTVLHLSTCLASRAYHKEQMDAMKKILKLVETNTSAQYSTLYIQDELKNEPIDSIELNLGGMDAIPRSSNYTAWSRQLVLPLTGQRIATLVASRKANRHVTYGISLLIETPIGRVVVANLLFRKFSDSYLSFQLLRGSSLAIMKLVHTDSPFMLACARGDITTMTHLIENEGATPNQITSEDMTPMSLAIRSGRVEAVALLLREGADADGLFGKFQTSPLASAVRCRHINIARLLLSYDASSQHITGYGWSPLFYLWNGWEKSDPIVEEFLQMFAARPDFALCHSGIIDKTGFGLAHLAAIFGTSREMEMLIKLGVDLFAFNGPLKWTAIQNAVFYGRADNFEVMLEHFRKVSVDTQDSRGWTLLHISASAGHDVISRRLLQLGANCHALSQPSFSHMPEELYGGCWTPAQVARAQSEERMILFLEAVKDVLGEAILWQEELACLCDIWVDATEKLIDLD